MSQPPRHSQPRPVTATDPQLLVAVVGPTASGKTRRAVDLARRLDGEIISGDSRQVYRSMDLGTGKDIDEYAGVPYHLIDVCRAGEKYNLYRYLTDAREAYDDIRRRSCRPILCGGSGLYVESFLRGMALPQVPENPSLRKSLEGKSLDELTAILASMKQLHNVTDLDSPKRAVRAIEIQSYYLEHPDEALDAVDPKPLDALIVGVDIDRESRRGRISDRLRQRLADGMVQEVEGLLAAGVPADDLIYYGLEYKYLTLYVIGRLTRQQMFEQLEMAIHQFAKRQMTWFRGMERRGFKINWLPFDLPSGEFVDRVVAMLAARQSSS